MFPRVELRSPTSNAPHIASDMNPPLLQIITLATAHDTMVCDSPPNDAGFWEENVCQ